MNPYIGMQTALKAEHVSRVYRTHSASTVLCRNRRSVAKACFSNCHTRSRLTPRRSPISCRLCGSCASRPERKRTINTSRSVRCTRHSPTPRRLCSSATRASGGGAWVSANTSWSASPSSVMGCCHCASGWTLFRRSAISWGVQPRAALRSWACGARPWLALSHATEPITASIHSEDPARVLAPAPTADISAAVPAPGHFAVPGIGALPHPSFARTGRVGRCLAFCPPQNRAGVHTAEEPLQEGRLQEAPL